MGTGSPAIDAGENTPPGGLGTGIDFGCAVRVQDGDGDGFAQVDLGAFEVPDPGAALSGLVALLCLLALRSRQRG